MIEISVKYFALLREQIGYAEKAFMLENPISIADFWQLYYKDIDNTNIKVAVNHNYVDWNYLIDSNIEIAFFPPVTGG